MKKAALTLALMLILSACGAPSSSNTFTPNDEKQSQSPQSSTQPVNPSETAPSGSSTEQVQASERIITELRAPKGNEIPYEHGSTEDFEYDIYYCGVEVRKYIGDEDITELVIPSEIEGVPVVSVMRCCSLPSIERIVLPDKLYGIRADAFRVCKNLTEINIPDTITIIDMSAFQGCESLESIYLPEGLEKIGSLAFADTGLREVNIPSSVEKIGEYTFSGCEQLEYVNFFNDITVIPNSMFSTCEALVSVYGIDNVEEFGTKAFFACDSLTEFTLPQSLKKIGEEAFSCCGTLRYIDIPITVEYIGPKAFYMCESLTDINIPTSISSIEEQTFFECTSLSTIYIPGNVKKIGKYAFANCMYLYEVTIDEGLEEIEAAAFWAGHGCVGLEIRLPKSTKKISNSFRNDVYIWYTGDIEALAGGEKITPDNKYTVMNPEAFYFSEPDMGEDSVIGAGI